MSFNGDLYPTAGADVVMTTKGDMVDYNTSRQRLAIGSTNQILQVKSALPSWETVDLADTVLTTAGDVLYENNTPELARLPKGSDADVLTLASGLPSWSAPAGGGKFALLETWTASGDATTKTFTTDRNLKDDYQELIIFVNGQIGVSAQDLTLAVNADTDGYDLNTLENLGSGTSSGNATASTNWIIGSSTLLNIATRQYEAEIHITWNPSAPSFQVSSRLCSIGKGLNIIGGYVAGAQADGICTDLTVAVSAGDMSEGLQINIYGVER